MSSPRVGALLATAKAHRPGSSTSCDWSTLPAMRIRNFTAPVAAQPVLDRLDVFEAELTEQLRLLARHPPKHAFLRRPGELVLWVLAGGTISSLATIAVAFAMR
jgi:hypothetical protein